MTNIVKIQTTFNDINLPAEIVWFSGCNNGKGKCSGCHNESLKIERRGLSLQQINKILCERRQLTEWVVYLGGEPLDHINVLKSVSEISNKYNYKQIIFTGYNYDEIQPHEDNYLKYINYIKIGRYIENMNSKDYHFVSTNQSIFKVSNGIISEKVYFYGINRRIEETLK